jgi:hypothetical protein
MIVCLQEAHVELPQDEARALQRTLRNQGEDRWVGFQLTFIFNEGSIMGQLWVWKYIDGSSSLSVMRLGLS